MAVSCYRIIKVSLSNQAIEGFIYSYYLADHGKLYQKKYLINAKWWREWKDFVNFEADDADVNSAVYFNDNL